MIIWPMLPREVTSLWFLSDHRRRLFQSIQRLSFPSFSNFTAGTLIGGEPCPTSLTCHKFTTNPFRCQSNLSPYQPTAAPTVNTNLKHDLSSHEATAVCLHSITLDLSSERSGGLSITFSSLSASWRTSDNKPVKNEPFKQ